LRQAPDHYQSEHLDELALAAVAHAGFEKTPQMGKLFGQGPALQGHGLIERTWLLLVER
jgi:hypothetical protein